MPPVLGLICHFHPTTLLNPSKSRVVFSKVLNYTFIMTVLEGTEKSKGITRPFQKSVYSEVGRTRKQDSVCIVTEGEGYRKRKLLTGAQSEFQESQGYT